MTDSELKFSGKKVLVTGAAGFIGSHLVEELVLNGASVKAFVRYNGRSDWGWLETLSEDIRKSVEVVPGDICDARSVREAAKGTEAVFHLAALIAIPYSYRAPQSYVDTNVQGTLNVLEAARDLSVGRVVVTSTSEVYGTAVKVPIDEKHPRQGQSPYSATKIAADALAEAYFRSFQVPVVTVRPFNTYGPRQSARAIIPTIITQLVSGRNEVQIGSLQPTRDLLYVKDTVAGFLHAGSMAELVGQEVNLCTGSEISIGDLANRLISMVGSSARIVCDSSRLRPAKSEVNRLLGTSDKIHRLTGWEPKVDLDTGLRLCIDWFKRNAHLYKAGIYNV